MSQEMSQESQVKPIGNTISIGARNQMYCWFFTLNMEECTASQLSQLLKTYCKSFKFQGESGLKTGYNHWQGTFSLKTKEYFSTVKNLFPCSIHLEGTKHPFKALNYCGKDDTRICGPYDHNSTFLKTIDASSFYQWQKELLEYVKGPVNDREILWYYDQKGGKGKTAMCKFLISNHNASFISNGKTSDLSFAINDPKIVVVNYTRDNEERINYGILESIKDGLVFSGKYESKTKCFDPPHLIVFANFSPRLESMSLDRWKIITL